MSTTTLRHRLSTLLSVGFSLLVCVLASAVTHGQPAQEGAPEALASARTWGAVLNPGGEVPQQGFKAIYIDTKNPRHVVASEVVPEIAINYVHDRFHGIPSEDFGAYWVGRMSFAEAQSRIIDVAQGWSKSRIIIDGQVVYEGGQNARTPFTFTPGEHLVEVEYVNNWHTTTFKVVFNDSAAPMTRAQIRQALQDRKLTDAEVHYVGVYDTGSKDLSVRVNVARSAKPVVLVLSSYEALKWVLNEASPGTVRAIVLGSFTPGTQVRGIDTSRVSVLPYKGRIGTYHLKPRCTCHASHFHCENPGSLLTTIQAVDELVGMPLTSFNGTYSAERFAVPGRLVNTALITEVQAAVDQVDVDRQRCRANANPDFERMFDEAPPAGKKPCTDLTKPECRAGQLQQADETLNETYRARLKQLAPEQAQQLRAEQRKWLRERNAACGLEPTGTSDADWIARLAQNQNKSLCVYGSTQERIERLRR